ncbi:MAG TPA: hypothetical protein VK671_16785 [Mucilaginibacter sp.]|jgi:hypothetical protein|nr:hypothetical protein [Mucilaginibacter sp.]
MKPIYICLLVIFLPFLEKCSNWKTSLVAKGSQKDAIQNAITDFLKTDPLSKRDTVFSVRLENIGDTILGVSILGYPDKLLPSSRNKIGTNYPNFPTNYVERNGKLFYWYDSDKSITEEIITVLNKYHKIDSLNINGFKGFPARQTGDSKKSVQYFFCQSNFTNYKKEHTTLSLGSYKPPHLECDK